MNNKVVNVNELQDYRKVDALDIAELQELVKNNAKFRDIVWNVCYENTVDMIEREYLHDAPFRYEYGCVYATQVHFDNRYGYGVKWDDIESWIERVQHDYCLFDIREFDHSALDLVKKAREYQDVIDSDDCGYISVKKADYDYLQNTVDQIRNELENMVKSIIDLELDSCDDIDYLVTEYGVVCLKGRTIKERVKLIISIAHPKFREQLMKEAEEIGWI